MLQSCVKKGEKRTEATTPEHKQQRHQYTAKNVTQTTHNAEINIHGHILYGTNEYTCTNRNTSQSQTTL